MASVARLDGVARVLNRPPVIGTADGWDPKAEFTEAGGAVQELRLEPGRWAISIQYASTQELRIAAPDVGFDREMEANLLFRGPSPYYSVGEIEVAPATQESEIAIGTGSAPVSVRFEATVADPPLIGRILGTESRAYLGTIAATPIAADEERSGLVEVGPSRTRGEVPLRRACSGYVDWYTIAPGTSEEELAAVEAPEPRPPQGSD
jgi:hypothetical protein